MSKIFKPTKKYEQNIPERNEEGFRDLTDFEAFSVAAFIITEWNHILHHRVPPDIWNFPRLSDCEEDVTVKIANFELFVKFEVSCKDDFEYRVFEMEVFDSITHGKFDMSLCQGQRDITGTLEITNLNVRPNAFIKTVIAAMLKY